MRTFVQESKASIDKNDLELLFNLLGDWKPKHILEIGTWKGYSGKIWTTAFNPETFVTLEVESKEKLEAISDPQYNYWFRADSHHPAILQDVKIVLPSIDFLFIDGDHSYEGVKKDWAIYSPLVKGVVVFHDIFVKELGVRKLWDEIKNDYNFAELRSKDGMGMGMGVLWT